MTDFLGHLVDAPLANILIIAGLLFLGVGVVGKVTGKIEPSTMGRLMAGLLGLVLLAAGVVAHIRRDSSNKNQAVVSAQPVLRAFSVTPAQVTKGGTVTISWDVLNADDVEIEPFGQVPATGDRVVQPEQTTTYRLSATNKSGGRSGTFQEVIVHEPKRKQAAEDSPTPPLPSVAPTGDDRNTSAENQGTTDEQPVYASEPPPPLPDYTQPDDPGGNSRWTPGSWYYDSGQADYYWVPGAWVTPPNGEVWTPPYWGYDGARYQWHAGYWSTSVGFYGGIAYGFGYFGVGYNQSAEHIHSLNRVSYNGGRGGIQKQPPPLELAANRDRIPALGVQMKLARDMRKNPQQYFKGNHGHPPIVVAKAPPLSPHHPEDAEKAKADKAKADAEKAKADKARADADKARADKARADADKAKADKARADADKAKADKARADADKAKADKAKADADKAKADKAKADAERARRSVKRGSFPPKKP
jgi:hypothetical protein